MIFLAMQYLLRRQRQTLFTFLGVFFGTVAYVGVSGFFLGFQGYMVQQLVDNTAQIHIQAREDNLTEHQLDSFFFDDLFGHVFWLSPPAGMLGYVAVQNPQSWYARLDADPRVEAYSPLMTAPALFTISKISVSASLIGCRPDQQAKVTTIADYMVEGKFSDLGSGGNRVILGDELMKRLGAGINKTVLISAGVGSPLPFKVIGRYYTGNRGADLQAYGALADVQKLKGVPNQVNEISVRLKDYSEAAAIATSWSQIAPERSESWDQQFVNILSVFRLQTTLRFAMILTVLIVAGFGIYNILNMTVTQKRQDIAILRSMGYDTFDVIMLFFSQGLIIGICGAAVGLVAGYLLCLYLQTIPFMGGPLGNTGGHLHISITLAIYLQATALALLTSSIASILPARAAGQLTPIDVIRQGG
jgi:lipoprotein-releasing system permease protein